MIRFGMSREANIAGTVADVLEKLENLRDAERKEKIQISLMRLPYEYKQGEELRQRQYDIEKAAGERAFQTGLERERSQAAAERTERAGLYGLTKTAMEKGYSGAPGLAKELGVDIGELPEMEQIGKLDQAKEATERARADYWKAQTALINKKAQEVKSGLGGNGDAESKKMITALQNKVNELNREIMSLENLTAGISPDKQWPAGVTPEMLKYLERLKVDRFNAMNRLNELLELPALEDYMYTPITPEQDVYKAVETMAGRGNPYAKGLLRGETIPIEEEQGLTTTGINKSLEEMTVEELMQELMR
ncbi:MAG: hypothetical protein ACOYVJ_02495 [Nitrospirota bacterium]